MAYSQATLIKRIRYELNDNPWYDTCTEAMDTTETGLDVADTTKYAIGTVVEFQDDGELCLVTALATSTTLTVIRNYRFSVGATAGTGTSHSINAVIAANPRYQYSEITEAITLAMNDLWPYVYRLNSVTLTPNTDGNHYYDLGTTPPLDISSIQQVKGSGATSSVVQYGLEATHYVRMLFNAPTAKITNGTGLYIRALWDSTNSIYVRGISPIDDTVSGSNYSYITGADEANCVLFYACSKLVGSTEIVRITQEDVSMGDASVQPGVRRNLAQYLEAKGLQLRRQWEIKLRQNLPRLPISRGRGE